jgi:hypothetical protein
MIGYWKQFIFCKNANVAAKEACHWCGKELYTCRELGGLCTSKKCKDLRVNRDKPIGREK